MKRILILLLSIALLFVLSCNKGGNTAKGKVEITFWHALGGPLGEALTQMVDEFNNTHKDIHVNAIGMGNYQALSQKLMASIQASNQPEIAQVYESWTANLISGDVIIPMDTFIDKDPDFKKGMSDIYPIFIESNTVNGKLYSFPFNKSVRVMYYNKDMFFKNKLDPQKAPANWEDFRKVAKQLTQDTNKDGNPDVWGTNLAISAWQFENLLLQAGGQIMDAGYTKPLFNSPEGIQALDFLNNLLNVDKSAYLSTGYDGQNDFLAGKVAMYESSSVSYAYMKKAGITFNLGIAPIPVNKTNYSIISGTNVCIFKKNDPAKEAAAWEFIKWFTDTKQTAKFSELTSYMPVRKSAMDEQNIQNMLQEHPELTGVYAQLDHARFEPQLAEWFELRKYLEEQVLEKVFRKTMSTKEALKKAESKFLEDLKKKDNK